MMYYLWCIMIVDDSLLMIYSDWSGIHTDCSDRHMCFIHTHDCVHVWGNAHLCLATCAPVWNLARLFSFSTLLPLVSPHISLLSKGYIEAAVIPVGARRIKVVEDKPSHSFLGNYSTCCHNNVSEWDWSSSVMAVNRNHTRCLL